MSEGIGEVQSRLTTETKCMEIATNILSVLQRFIFNVSKCKFSSMLIKIWIIKSKICFLAFGNFKEM